MSAPLPSHRLALAIVMSLSCAATAAQEDAASALLATQLDRLNVIGSSEKAQETAGSATYIDGEQLEIFNYTDIHRVLRKVPGVYVVDEEGYGVRPNIGIRGSGTDRNSRITVLEDGVLIAPAPYAAPAAYYFPTAARMSAIEVLKGAAAIRTGPRTTGGAINLISTPIPEQTSGMLDLALGGDSTFLGHGWVGGSAEQAGWLLETAQQQTDGFKDIDGGGDSGYELRDYRGKFRINTDSNAAYYQELELRVGRTDNDGDESYLGLSNADFDADPFRRYAASQLDRIETAHEQYQLRHFIELGDRVDLSTALYRNEFARNWYKLNDVAGQGISAILADPDAFADEFAWITGADSPDNALRLRNNNRAYLAQGVQTLLGWRIEGNGAEHQLQFGLRWHEDEEDRFQDDDRYRMEDGRLVLTSDGTPGTQTNRIGSAEAWSFHVEDEIRFGQWILTPGLRYERIALARTDYATAVGGRDAGPIAVRKSDVDAWMPGIGATWLLSDSTSLFASVHKGFNPPGPGSNANPEESINLEVGARYVAGKANAELVLFNNDYDNLVGTCTASTGGDCDIGDQFDGGEARVRGVEASLGFDFGRRDLGIPFRVGYTYTDASFRNSFVSSFGEWGTVEAGDDLPYLPEHLFFSDVGLTGANWGLTLGANFVDDMRVEAGSGTPAAGGATDEAWVFDLSGRYTLSDRTELFARVENLTGEEYIVARRPAGARPGRERVGFVGVRFAF